MAGFTKILKNRNFFLLWIGQIISQFGERLGQMALIGFVYSRAPGSSMQIAKVLSFTIIPVFLVGPLAGVYVDRWDRRKTMYVSDLIRSLLVLTIALFFLAADKIIPVYIIIFLMFSLSRFFVPAKLAIVPDLVQEKDLLIANSLINTTGMIAAILGFGLSGILVEWFGAKSGFYLNSLSFFASAALIFFIIPRHSSKFDIRRIGKEIVEVIQKSVVQEIKEGFGYFFTQKAIFFTAWINFFLWAALGAVYAVIIVFVQTTLGTATKDLGILAMFLGIGLFLGALVYGRFGQKISHQKIIFASLVTSGIMLVLFVGILKRYPFSLVAAGLALCLGIVVAPIIIASNTIIHNASERQMRGKVFSSLEIVMHLGFLLAMFLSSFLAERMPKEVILTSVGVIVGVLGASSFIYHCAHHDQVRRI
ncbi:MAG: MFS transporter [Candidatus Omnitrophica bacterium]|jgi:MFS family permease|nr:MFS transporter [Candidatus Omnitrophota bacterium]